MKKLGDQKFSYASSKINYEPKAGFLDRITPENWTGSFRVKSISYQKTIRFKTLTCLKDIAFFLNKLCIRDSRNL